MMIRWLFMVFLQIFQLIRKVSKQFIYLLWKAFPDIRIILDIIIEGNKVVCRYYLTGTHDGAFGDLQSTGKKFKVNGMTEFSFNNERIIERWNLVDMVSLKEQLTG